MRSFCRAVSYAAAAALAASVAGAQSHRDFSGAWTRVTDPAAGVGRSVAATGDASFRRGDMGSGWGTELAIAPRSDSLVVEYAFFSTYDLQPKLRFAYALDGSESRNGVMIGHAESVQRGRVTWRGDTLVITTRHAGPSLADGRTVSAEMRQALWLDAAGTLVVETTRAGVMGGAASTTRAVYSRK